jgi:hypothetical protein
MRAMLTVLLVADDAQRLADTLEALVPAAVDGLVRQVVVSAGLDPAIAAVTEDAGAELVSGEGVQGRRLAAAAALARSPWLLIPANLPTDWRPRVEAQLAKGAAGRFGAGLIDGLLARPRGLLVQRAVYEAAGGFKDVEAAEADLVRRLGRLDRV